MTISAPSASICIPCYNGAPYLEACLASAIQQTHTDLEILVLDDGSSDDTVRIAERMAASDARSRIVLNPNNLGLVGN